MEREMDLRGKEAASLSSLVKKEYQIPDSYYFGEVKRGLRNSDGTGVLIGVTKVGSVQGYLIEDGRRIPVPGKLYYRGIDLNEIVEAHRKSGTFGYEEVAYLLLMGHLPTKSELSYFNDIMCRARKLPEGFTVPEGRVKPWGTAHAILVAEEAIGDAPFAVINADDYYGPQGFKLIYDYLSTHADGDRYAWAMVGFLLGNTVSANGSVSRGVCVTDAQHNLVSVTERTCIEPYDGGIHYSEDGGKSWCDLPADAVVSMNLWGFTPAYVRDAKAGFAAFLKENLPVNPLKCEYYLPTVVTNALNNGEADVHVLTSADKWHGITYREDKPELVAALKQMSEAGLYPTDRLF